MPRVYARQAVACPTEWLLLAVCNVLLARSKMQQNRVQQQVGMCTQKCVHQINLYTCMRHVAGVKAKATHSYNASNIATCNNKNKWQNAKCSRGSYVHMWISICKHYICCMPHALNERNNILPQNTCAQQQCVHRFCGSCGLCYSCNSVTCCMHGSIHTYIHALKCVAVWGFDNPQLCLLISVIVVALSWKISIISSISPSCVLLIKQLLMQAFSISLKSAAV